MKTESMKSAITAFSACLAVALTACTPLTTTEHSAKNEGKGGVPYVLPTSVMAVEIEVLRNAENEFQDVRFRLAPRLVPDPESGIYYLSSNLNMVFQSDHDITVNNGLLTSVNTTDVGTTGDVLLSIVNSGINLYKFRSVSGLAQSETANPLLTAHPSPTPEEIQHVLGLIQGDKMAFNYHPRNGLLRQDLPGTDGVLFLRSRINDVNVSGTTGAICAEHDHVAFFRGGSVSCKFGCKKGVPRPDHKGVLTKLLAPKTAELRLCLDPENLRNKRVAALEIAFDAVTKSRAGLQKTLGEQYRDRSDAGCGSPSDYEDRQQQLREDRDKFRGELDTLSRLKMTAATEARLKALNSRIADVEKQSADVVAKINACETHTSNIKSTGRSIRTAEIRLCELAGMVSDNGRTPPRHCNGDRLDPNTKPAAVNRQCGVGNFNVLCGDYPVKQNTDVVMLTQNDILRVPVWRAGFGKTENRLAFSDGILTGFHSQHPSTAQVVGKTLESALQGLVAVPAELVQLKVDLTNKEAELAQGQKELLDAVDQLSDEVRREGEIDNEVRLLEAELRLAQTRAETDAGLGTLDSVAQRARLEEQQRLLALQSQVAGAEVTLDQQLSALSGTRAETAEVIDQIELLRQQNLLTQQEVDRTAQLSALSGTQAETTRLQEEIARLQQENLLREQQQDPQINEINREAAVLNARRARLEAELELERKRLEIIELERELDEIRNSGGGE